jgi:hypothetical protein
MYVVDLAGTITETSEKRPAGYGAPRQPKGIELRFGLQRARKPWRTWLGPREARILAYALLSAAEQAERS